MACCSCAACLAVSPTPHPHHTSIQARYSLPSNILPSPHTRTPIFTPDIPSCRARCGLGLPVLLTRAIDDGISTQFPKAHATPPTH
eukprot:7705621-Alexandrium_andersonii.AAC.1